MGSSIWEVYQSKAAKIDERRDQTKRLLLVLATLAAAATIPAVASASTPVTISIFPCAFSHGGHQTVPADSTITFRGGWAASNRGLVQDFLKAVTVTASLNGTPISNTASYWGPIANIAPGAWASFWVYPTGITLASGDSMTFTTDWVLSHRVYDGSFISDRGSIFGGPVSCTVTAS